LLFFYLLASFSLVAVVSWARLKIGCALAICSGNKGNLGMPSLPGQGCSFHSFRTNTYKLSFMESPSGIKVCALSFLACDS
jgi:hypothetical protein